MKIQRHLRAAATLLGEQQFAGALAEVDAALAIDPESLQAHALRDRIVKVRGRTQQVTVDPPQPQPRSTQFVPLGVNAESWIGFEQRIQERRFRALMETARRSLAEGDSIAALVALEEARELRPDAPEVSEVAERVAVLPTAIPAAASRSRLRSRTFGALALLLVGMTFLIGLDWVRTTEPVGTTAALSVVDTAPTPALRVTPESQTPVIAPLETAIEGDETPVAPSPIVEPTPLTPVATVGSHPPTNFGPPTIAAAPPVRLTEIEERPAPPTSREISDDFVAPQVQVRRRDVPVGAAPPPSTASRDIVTPSAVPPPSAPPPSAAPPPVSRDAVAPSAVPPSAAPTPAAVSPRDVAASVVREPAASIVPQAAAAAAMIARGDENRVAAVLNQYARAYGRLDASAARQVWPTVNERALARAFASLESQDVSFDNCAIDVRGETANASCRGRASYVGKVGRREQQTETRLWRFELRREGDAWKIESAEARRQ